MCLSAEIIRISRTSSWVRHGDAMRSGDIFLSQLEIPVDEIYSSMGFRNVCPDDETRRVTESLLNEASVWVHPCYEYILLGGECRKEDVCLGEVTFNTGHIIAGQLRKSECFAVFVASAGDGWKQWIQFISARGDLLQSYVADCIGSQIVESTADFMEKRLQEYLYENGLGYTNRFSPGYCGWPVSQQPLLFSLFPDAHPCGVTLTESCLMMPEKSVSGIIGIGEDVHRMPYTCNICTMDKCLRRRG